MRTFEMKKLVRDKIIDNILKREGSKVNFRKLNNKEFIKELENKLQEELEELMEVDLNNKKELINELSDIQLLIDYFSKVLGIKNKDLKNVQKEKAQKAGNFDKRIYIETVGLQDDDIEWIEYYQKKGFKEL